MSHSLNKKFIAQSQEKAIVLKRNENDRSRQGVHFNFDLWRYDRRRGYENDLFQDPDV